MHGVSTRKVDDLVAALGLESGISKSEVSRDLRRARRASSEPSGRGRLAHIEFPYVFLDATYLKGRVDHQVVSRAVVVATGVSMDGDREVLGLCRRRLRGRGLLDRVPALAAGPGA